MINDKNWHAVTIRENWEKKIAIALSKKKIESYLPLNKVTTKHWDGTYGTSLLPLFPGIIFLHLYESQLSNVKQTSEFIKFLYWRDGYAIISNEDISAIKAFLNVYKSIILEKAPIRTHFEKKNPHIYEMGSPFNDENDMCDKIFLSTLGYSLVATVQIKKQENIYYHM